MKQLDYIDWRQTDYPAALERQLSIVKQRSNEEVPDQLIFTEHPPTYTLGSRKGAADNLLLDEGALHSLGRQVHRSNRGGDITYHGPGQLVAYPILSLDQKRDLHGYLRDIEQVIINALGCLGLASGRREGKTGIWLENRKIAAIGIAVKQWVTYHGFAINVNNDLAPFSDIVPCGISPEEGAVTSIKQELGTELNMAEVKDTVSREFWGIFKSA